MSIVDNHSPATGYIQTSWPDSPTSVPELTYGQQVAALSAVELPPYEEDTSRDTTRALIVDGLARLGYERVCDLDQQLRANATELAEHGQPAAAVAQRATYWGSRGREDQAVKLTYALSVPENGIRDVVSAEDFAAEQALRAAEALTDDGDGLSWTGELDRVEDDDEWEL